MEIMAQPNLSAGHFKIVDEEIEDVVAFVSEWRTYPDGHRFKHLVVHDGGFDDKKKNIKVVIIEFMYALPEDGGYEREHKDFRHKYVDRLKRKFGEEQVPLWNISCPIYVL